MVGVKCLALGTVISLEADEIVFPGVEWSRSEPAALGMDGEVLNRLAEEIGGRGVIVKDGHLVKSWGPEQRRGDWYGSSNPLYSTLLFFAIEEGRVSGVRESVDKYRWALDFKDKGMTFFHLANMTSGYGRPEVPGAAWAFRSQGAQLFQMTLFDRVFNAPPLAVIMQRDRLGPLLFQDRPALRERTNTLLVSARDFARLAWFWCQKGKWGDRQLLPKHYFDRYLKPQVPIDHPITLEAEDNDYLHIGHYRDESGMVGVSGPGIFGYGWWFNGKGRENRDRNTWPDAPADTVMSIGQRGNIAVMIPSMNLVLVSAYSKWGEFLPGDPDSAYNRYTKALVGSVR